DLRQPRPAIAALAWTLALTVGGLWFASVLQQKNLAGEYRYHFVYYPAAVVLFAAALAALRPWVTAAVLALGIANSVLFLNGEEFPKPTRPRQVAAVMSSASSGPLLVAIGEASFHETVVGLTFLRELGSPTPHQSETQYMFIRRSDRYPSFVRGDGDAETFWSRFPPVNAHPPAAVLVWSPSSAPSDYPLHFTSRSVVGTT